MSDGPMKLIVRFGHKPHPLDTKKYGAPRLALYWAGKGFVEKGIHLWNGKRNIRIVPLPDLFWN